MKNFAYTPVATLPEAASLLAQTADSRIIAGGTDLLTEIREGIIAPPRLIAISRVAGLNTLRVDESGAEFGALVSLQTISTHPQVVEKYPALAQAASLSATLQLRNMATIGGNLNQAPHCWYYRSEDIVCAVKGGDKCYASPPDAQNQQHSIFGGQPCVAVQPSDPAAALVAYDATIEIVKDNGAGNINSRTISAADFFGQYRAGAAADGIHSARGNVLESGEIIRAVRLPAPSNNGRGIYVKEMERKAWSYALASVAAIVVIDDGGTISSVRLVLGGVAPTPLRIEAAEALLIGQAPSEDLFARVADAALAGAKPLSRNRYKVALAKGAIKKALRAVCA